MRSTMAMVLAGDRVNDLAALTVRRPKSAVIYGGSYRIVDCVLTNLSESGIDRVGVLPQFRFFSLAEHIGFGEPWDLCGRTRSVAVLAPHQDAEDTDWYRGTADALWQNVDYIESYAPDDVLVVSGDHIYRMDYWPLRRFHEESGADLTMLFTPVAEGASRFGIGELDESGRIVGYEEKPARPATNLASMSVYLFRREALVRALREFARKGRPAKYSRTAAPWDREAANVQRTFQISDELVPQLVASGRAYGMVHQGYWEYARTLDAYYRANMDLIGNPPRVDLRKWSLRTNIHYRRVADACPTQLGAAASVTGSLVSAGCRIEGAVERSVLSPDVFVGEGAVVRDSVLWHGCRIEAGAVVDRVIADKYCVVGRGARIGCGEESPPNLDFPESLKSGLSVLGRTVEVPEGCEVGRNAVVFTGVKEKQWGRRRLDAGCCLRASPMNGMGS